MEQNTAQTLKPEANPVSTQKPSTSIGLLDSFETILMFISLYVLSTSLILLLNLYIDKWFPATSINNYAQTLQSALFPGYASSLIVSFPFFAFFFLATTKRRMMYPAIAHLTSRRILIYLTLVITFITVFVSLIAIVYSFLAGNISMNFVLKLLALVGVSGVIFVYFLEQAKGDRHVNA